MKSSNRAFARRDRAKLSLVRTFQSEADEINERRVPLHIRTTLLALAGMFIVLGITTTLFQIDRVVTSLFGQIVTTEPTVVIQPLDPSIIKTINVQEGDRVKKGQLLATLDSTFAQADVTALQSQISSLQAEIARCEAELAGKPFTYVPGDGPGARQYADMQRSLYEQRQAQFKSQVTAFDQQIAQAAAAIARLRNDEKRYGDREKLAAQLEGVRSQLVVKNLDSRVNLLQTTDARTEMLRNVELDQNTLVETQHLLDATKASRDAFIQQWNAQTSQEMVGAKNNYDQAATSLDKAQKHKDLVREEAPDDAIVLRIAQLSVGSILQQGQPFIELALLSSPVEAEIYVNPRDVGFIRPGDDTTLKLDAYHFVEHGSAEGRLRWVSQGTFVTSQMSTGGSVDPTGTAQGSGPPAPSSDQSNPTGNPLQSFYKARVTIDKLQFNNVPKDFNLTPGMTLEADIHVGTRSLFWYLVQGIVRGFDEAMREP